VWLLLGNCVGDNNQLLALAEALGYPFDAKTITYNGLRFFPFMRRNLTIVAAESRALMRGPWPDLVIGAGYGAISVARYIRRQSGGRSKLIHIGNPRGKIEDFDLQITTPQYAREPVPNVLELPFPIGNPAKRAQSTFEERQWLRAFPRPRRLVAIGGPARNWRLDEAALTDALRAIGGKKPSGSLIVAVSPRTPVETASRVAELVSAPGQTLVANFPSFGTLLSESDEIYVTADSVSMISEAVLSGNPVGLIPIRRSFRGRLSTWLWEQPLNKASLPNFANFWKMLHKRRLAGTVELPVASQVCDTVESAADAVRSLLAPGDAFDEGRT
jgi:mitochondrial fission protein ELM1